MNGVVTQIEDAWRSTRLTGAGPPATRLRLAWADLHNHSLFSDGAGDPEQAFAQLREAGLDVAALTDHASIPADRIGALHPGQYPDAAALATARTAPNSVDAEGWRRTAELADAHDEPGRFTALRGFEWTEPWLGHINVWFSRAFLPVTTPGTLSGLRDFLADTEPDALFAYNHPGREPGRLESFALLPGALPERMVALEVFNRAEDFLFTGCLRGLPSPIVECLDAGWRPGLVGSSDEHGRCYGLAGKGRTGLWLTELSRAGVYEALLARRAFATREVGLRLDATLDGVRMGGVLPDSGSGTARRRLAVDVGLPGQDGAPVELQLLTGDGGGQPLVFERLTATAGHLVTAEIDIPDRAAWVVLRVADPARGYGGPAPAGHDAATWALAYASPWWVARDHQD